MGVILYLSLWFRAEDRGKAIATFMAAIPVSNIVGAPFSEALLGLLMLSLFCTLVLLQPSCGGSKTPVPVSGTPSGLYPLSVTATSGSFSKTVPFQLTVTP